MTPSSKNHELTLNSCEAKIEYDKDLFNRLYKFMKKHGWIKQDLPTGEQVIEFHKMVCLDNPEWPSDETYVQIYNQLFIRFNNEDEKSISMFMYLISNLDQETRMKKKKAMEKQVLKQSIPEVNSTGQPTGRIENWDPKYLKQQFNVICMMYDEAMVLKRIKSDSATYTKAIYNELIKRGLIEPMVVEEKEPEKVI